MHARTRAAISLALIAVCGMVWGQNKDSTPAESELALRVSSTNVISSLPSSTFGEPACDNSGNIYAIFGSGTPRTRWFASAQEGKFLRFPLKQQAMSN